MSENLYDIVSRVMDHTTARFFDADIQAVQDFWNPRGDDFDLNFLLDSVDNSGLSRLLSATSRRDAGDDDSESLVIETSTEAGENEVFVSSYAGPPWAQASRAGANRYFSRQALAHLVPRLDNIKGTEAGLRIFMAMIGVQAQIFPGWKVSRYRKHKAAVTRRSMVGYDALTDEEQWLTDTYGTVFKDEQQTYVDAFTESFPYNTGNDFSEGSVFFRIEAGGIGEELQAKLGNLPTDELAEEINKLATNFLWGCATLVLSSELEAYESIINIDDVISSFSGDVEFADPVETEFDAPTSLESDWLGADLDTPMMLTSNWRFVRQTSAGEEYGPSNLQYTDTVNPSTPVYSGAITDTPGVIVLDDSFISFLNGIQWVAVATASGMPKTDGYIEST